MGQEMSELNALPVPLVLLKTCYHLSVLCTWMWRRFILQLLSPIQSPYSPSVADSSACSSLPTGCVDIFCKRPCAEIFPAAAYWNG